MDGKAYLKKGKNELESKKYEDAILCLSFAEKEFPLLGDYAMLWLSDAYHETGNHKESLKTIRNLLNRYPLSPLKKKARIREIKEVEEVSEENIQQMFESYIKDYLDDTEMKYAYAQWLKKNDKTDIAKPVFKEIYLDAGPFSEMAYNELSPSDINVEDMIKRASNLMKTMDFKGAESALRSAMTKDDGSLKNEILKGLGLSLFRQKRYREAADVYKEANEKYWEVRSLYRAGERKAFDSALHELLKIEDKRAGSILITVASDRRKNGKNEEAIRMYRDVIEKYPSETEDALWGIGWAYFLTGEYKKASDIFTKLYNNYNDTKYLYWKARSLEATGENALDIYHALMKKDGDFYSIMSYVRTKRPLERSSTPPFNSLLSKGGYRGVKGDEGGFSNETQKFPETTTNFIGGIPVGSKKIDRVEALFELGLSKEALLELIQISKTISLIEDLLYIGLKFQELGEYKHMASLATKIPYRERLNHLCYPLAYWDTVEALSKKYGVDPFLVLSIVREESMFDLKAMSAAGALGLMQVMPQIAYRLNSKLQLGISTAYQLYNYKDNIHLGTYYLSTLIKEFGSYTYAIAAYNAGEEAVKRWLQKGNYRSADEFIEDIPYSETKNYVKRVITSLFEYKRIYPIDDSTKEISLGNL